MPAGDVNAQGFALVSFACAAFALLLFFEVIRPFHDLAKDGPLAIMAWAIGAATAILGFFLSRSLPLLIVALLANIIPISAIATLFALLHRSTMM